MRIAGQLDIGPRSGRGVPYSLNPWIRRGVAPIARAARWERRNRFDGAAPIRRLDLESACTIISPLLGLPHATTGICGLAVGTAAGSDGTQEPSGWIEARNGALWRAGSSRAYTPRCSAAGAASRRCRRRPLSSNFSHLSCINAFLLIKDALLGAVRLRNRWEELIDDAWERSMPDVKVEVRWTR